MRRPEDMADQDGITSDEELMVRAAEGDMDAFEQLVQRHQQAALNIAHRFLGRSASAEDVVQEAFLKILAGSSRYRPTARFRTYLYNVIWHLCVDSYRRKRPLALDALPPLEQSAEGPAEAVLRSERSEALHRAVDQLPPRQRMALVLKHFEGLSYEDIAEVMDCSPSAVDALLSRARNALREALQDLL
jgi:RNA polymerase sigma-70 factor (ECF subfamily)